MLPFFPNKFVDLCFTVIFLLLSIELFLVGDNFCFGDTTDLVETYVTGAKQYFEKIKTLRFVAVMDDTLISAGDYRFADSGGKYEGQTKVTAILDFETHQGTIQYTHSVGGLSEDMYVNGVLYNLGFNPSRECFVVLTPTLKPAPDEEMSGYPLTLMSDTRPIFLGMWSDRKSGFISVFDIMRRNGTVTVTHDDSAKKVRLKSASKNESIEIELDIDRHLMLCGLTYKNSDVSQKNRLIDYKYVVTDLIQQRDVFFPRTYTIESHSTSEIKKLNREKNEINMVNCLYHDTTFVRFADVDINFDIPPKSITFFSKIENYTEVEVRDTRQIKYVWVDGKVKPLTDELAEERLRGVKFIPGVAEPRFWMMFVGTLMVVLAVISLIWRYYTDKNGKGKGDDDNE